MLGLHVSLLFRSCIHVRATCFVVVSVMYTCRLHVCCCFGHVYMLGLHVSLLFRSCIHVRATCFVVVSVMYTC